MDLPPDSQQMLFIQELLLNISWDNIEESIGQIEFKGFFDDTELFARMVYQIYYISLLRFKLCPIFVCLLKRIVAFKASLLCIIENTFTILFEYHVRSPYSNVQFRIFYFLIKENLFPKPDFSFIISSYSSFFGSFHCLYLLPYYIQHKKEIYIYSEYIPKLNAIIQQEDMDTLTFISENGWINNSIEYAFLYDDVDMFIQIYNDSKLSKKTTISSASLFFDFYNNSYNTSLFDFAASMGCQNICRFLILNNAPITDIRSSIVGGHTEIIRLFINIGFTIKPNHLMLSSKFWHYDISQWIMEQCQCSQFIQYGSLSQYLLAKVKNIPIANENDSLKYGTEVIRLLDIPSDYQLYCYLTHCLVDICYFNYVFNQSSDVFCNMISELSKCKQDTYLKTFFADKLNNLKAQQLSLALVQNSYSHTFPYILNNFIDEKGNTILFYIQNERYLKFDQIDILHRNNEGQNILHHILKLRNANFFSLLIHHCPQLAHIPVDPEGNYPIHIAAMSDWRIPSSILHHFDIDKLNNNGDTAFHLAFKHNSLLFLHALSLCDTTLWSHRNSEGKIPQDYLNEDIPANIKAIGPQLSVNDSDLSHTNAIVDCRMIFG